MKYCGVFLGGSCEERFRSWRTATQNKLTSRGVPFFNPFDINWSGSNKEYENNIKNHPLTLNAFFLVSGMESSYSVKEIQDLVKMRKTVLLCISDGFIPTNLYSGILQDDLKYLKKVWSWQDEYDDIEMLEAARLFGSQIIYYFKLGLER